MTGKNRRENARREAQLGDDALRAAEALLELGLPNDAVSRAYYAAFHYGRAVLLLDGLEPRSHRGVVALLERRAVEGRGPSQQGVSRLARLQTFRSLADYSAGERLESERAAEECEAARAFVDEAREVLARASEVEPDEA